VQQFYRLILQFLVSDCDTHRTSQIADKKSWNLECRLAGADDSPQLMRSVPWATLLLYSAIPERLASAASCRLLLALHARRLVQTQRRENFGWRVSSMRSKDHGKQDDKRLACLHAVRRRGQLEFSLWFLCISHAIFYCNFLIHFLMLFWWFLASSFFTAFSDMGFLWVAFLVGQSSKQC
jgi:hypothetical protein